MTEDFQTKNEQKNTVATVGMWFSIIWLIALMTVILAWLWFPLLFVWFILWIVGLFYKPRGKARVAVCIPLVVFVTITSIVCYVWKSVKTPAYEFVDWMKIEFENIDDESFDEERFNVIVNGESDSIISSMTEEEFTALIESSTWSNLLEKWSYAVFGLVQQVFENSLEKYNDGYIPEFVDEDDNVITVDVDIEDGEDETVEGLEIDAETGDLEGVEDFTQAEQNDIEEILNILE